MKIELEYNMKIKLKYNDRVKIHSTSSSLLDGKTGTLSGIASKFPTQNFWIVELDIPLTENRAIVLTDACLEFLE